MDWSFAARVFLFACSLRSRNLVDLVDYFLRDSVRVRGWFRSRRFLYGIAGFARWIGLSLARGLVTQIDLFCHTDSTDSTDILHRFARRGYVTQIARIAQIFCLLCLQGLRHTDSTDITDFSACCARRGWRRLIRLALRAEIL